MKVTKIIEEELGQELEKVGFQPAFQERYVWPYEREKDGVKQTITVITDRYEKRYLRVLFDTNAYGQKTREFRDFVPEEGAEHWEFWGYKNEEELRTILREFKRLIVSYGMDFLDSISKPATDAIPTEELERYLYLNHESLYEEYSAMLQTQGKSAEEVIEVIYQTIEQNLNQPFENVKDLLVGLTALYGHTISWGDKGKWVWDEGKKWCRLKEILGTKKEECLLRYMFSTWDYWRKHKKIGRGLFDRYETILVYYYRDHPEEIEYDEEDDITDSDEA
ncbi:MAG: hypothetical protein J6D08_14155 [Lachnospiraceae bacterium]|nr:hypothetical protein [Lachnospiraceae bacterium]